MATFLRLLRIAWPLRGQFALGALLAFATLASGVGLLTTSAYLIAMAAVAPSVADLQVAIVAVRFFGLSRGGFRYLERVVTHQAAFRLLAEIRAWFYERIEPLAPAALEAHRGGDLLARIVDDVEDLQFLFLRVITPPVIAGLGLSALAATLWPLSPPLTLTLLLLLLIPGLLFPLLLPLSARRTESQAPSVRGRLKADLVEGLQGRLELLALDRMGERLDRLARLSQELSARQLQALRREELKEALLTLATHLTPLAALFYLTPMVRGGGLSGVVLAVIVVGALAAFTIVEPLPAAIGHLTDSLKAADRIFELADAQEPVHEPASSDGEWVPHPAELIVTGLSFSYDDESAALHEVEFTLASGAQVALVGPSGAGKSSLVNLFLRFWEYDEGEIYLGGRELRTLPGDRVRSFFNVVSQRSYLFHGTLCDNLAIARPGAAEGDMLSALRLAGLEGLLATLPDGLDTPVGEWGRRLSAGQRKRVAIARTLLSPAPYLLLDEPTADLDALTERQLLEDLRDFAQGRTTLLITHRLVGLEGMDRILVMNRGRIVQRGAHAELVGKPGLYRELWRLQVKRLAVDLLGTTEVPTPIEAA